MPRLTRLLSKKEAYSPEDLPTALRIGSTLWAMGMAIAVLLLPLSPPDEAIGSAGWIVTAALIAGGFGALLAYRSPRLPWTFDRLYLSSFSTIVAIGLMQWLAGGVGAPYFSLLLLSVIYVASIYSPREIAGFMAALALCLAAPFVYDGWGPDAAAIALANFLIWCAVAGITHTLMTRVRAQRQRMRVGAAEAREEARVDGLTGVGNRRAFEEAIANEIARTSRTGVTLSMAMGDIESFKRINDRWGHVEGDECLRTVARSLSDALREPDRCFRWGGDEFALLFPGTGAEGAVRVSERLQVHISTGAIRPDGEPLLIRFGTAELTQGMSASDLVAAADLALLSSKSESAESSGSPSDPRPQPASSETS
jgi:diguanylate cyclase (GGDEF)-like protein